MTIDDERKINEWVNKIDEITEGVEILQSAEQEYYDSRSEKWQESGKGQEVYARIVQLQEAYNLLDNARDDLDSLSMAEL